MNYRPVMSLSEFIDTMEYNKEKFPWGEVIQEYYIGDCYLIVRFHPWLVPYQGKVRTPNKLKTEYHVFVNKMDTHRTFHHLDDALAHAIAYKYEGSNGMADSYFMILLRNRYKDHVDSF